MSKFSQEDLDKVLNKIKEGPIGRRKEHNWDASNRMIFSNLTTLPGVKQKMSKAAKERHKDGWASPNRHEWTVEDNPNKGGLKSEDNPTYGQGARYRELITGFEGTFLDMKNQFPGFDIGLVGRKRVRKDSRFPDNKWIKIQDGIMKPQPKKIHFTVEQVLEIKKIYNEDISITARDISEQYNINQGVINNLLSNKEIYNHPKYGPPVSIRSKPTITCPHCGKTSSNYKRWHGDRCKMASGYVKPALILRPDATIYIELTTGFQGTVREMNEKFGIDKGAMDRSYIKNKPLTKGKNQGLHFKKLS